MAEAYIEYAETIIDTRIRGCYYCIQMWYVITGMFFVEVVDIYAYDKRDISHE
jgi:hypothetical protein